MAAVCRPPQDVHVAAKGSATRSHEEPQMRRSPCIAAVIASLGLAAHAADAVVDFPAHAKIAEASPTVSAIVSGSGFKQVNAPFAGTRDPSPDFLFREEQILRGPQGACELSTRDVCYDAADARIVYRPARRYMPKIDGLTAENVQLRPNRIVLKYSFR